MDRPLLWAIDLDKGKFLQWGHLSFALISLVLQLFNGLIGFSFIPRLIILLVLYRLFFQVKKNLQYSYWFFAVLFLSIFALSLNGAIGVGGLLLPMCLLMAMVFLGWEMFILFSPIYYPLIRWWEYDFRYRDDLKVKVSIDGKVLEGRLTDLRREAGCVAFFANYDHGAPLTLEVENLTDNPPIKGEVVSRRRYSLGRPYTYGVRFLLDSTQDKDNYHHLIKHWKARKRRIKKLKYGD